MKKHIAFIKLGSFSHINDAVETQLRGQFPDCRLVVVDVWNEFFSGRRFVHLGKLQAYRYYGKDIWSKRRLVSDCMLRTPWAIHAAQAWLKRRLAAYSSTLSFTFQTQSLFNGSQPRVPHFVYTDHAHLANLTYPGYDPHNLYPVFYTAVEKQIYADACVSFVMSRHVQQCLVDDYDCPQHKVSCVFAGSNMSLPEPCLDIARYESKRILFNGVDWDRKGGPDLIEALKIVWQRHADASLVVLGCAPKLKLDNVHATGLVPLAEVPRHYAAASVFCMPTKLEPFGIAFVEAMHSALPIVATQIGALPDFVVNGRNGYLAPPGDIQSLAAALCLLLDSPQRCREFGSNGLALAQQRYTWDAVGARIKERILAELS